ncbi:MAG: hypothetical protein KAW41_04420 [Candidatus Diapherotrites archaeon]|nr:hypothetical protein [Candidatus Diapherotrites archaeon]
MASRWNDFVDGLEARGIPLYVLTDPIEGLGLPSWAVLTAIGLIILFGLAFLLFPGVKYRLDITTTPGARVTVVYGEQRLTSMAEDGTASFSLPLGAQLNVKITKNGCEGKSVDLVMIDNYAIEKPLDC